VPGEITHPKITLQADRRVKLVEAGGQSTSLLLADGRVLEFGDDHALVESPLADHMILGVLREPPDH
jgi:hypothetical protein